MVLMAGRASYMMATRNTAPPAKAFEALVARYPETPNVHYAYGVFLLQEQPDKAIEEFKRELEAAAGARGVADADCVRVPEARRGAGSAAVGAAGRRGRAATRSRRTRRLGQALLETGDVDGAIKELLVGIKLAPDSPGLHFSLARAYQRAGRAWKTRLGNATSSRASIAWRGRSGAARSRSGGRVESARDAVHGSGSGSRFGISGQRRSTKRIQFQVERH